MVFLLFLAAFVQLSLQQDPVEDFCRRFGHQTAVLGRRLFIDGGQVNFNPISQYAENYTNDHLLYNDLDDITGDGMPQLFANLSKGDYVPDVSGGILWADDLNGIFYQYGGEFSGAAQPFQLWAYDAVYNSWNLTQLTTASIQRTSWGAGVSVNQTGTGYYYGGWLSNATTPGWIAAPQMSSSLVVYDMVNNAWTNNTGPDSTGRAEGVMVFLPASDGGLLVYFGGIEAANDGTTVGSNMSTIHIFDINSSKWYTQTATGDVPENRRRFCAGAAWPDDRSSYNIYLYGGAGIAPNTTGFDDVYILSLPTFTWIKWWPTEPGPGNPHHSMTCNVIDGSQMVIIGGTFPLTDNCDSANVWGTHNLNLGENGPSHATWDRYYPNITTYDVPDAVVAKVGGSMWGGADKTQPQAWDNRDLPVYFSRQASFEARTATRAMPTATLTPSDSGGQGSSSHIGAIVGGAVGGAIALIILVILGICCCRRRRWRIPDEARKGRRSTPAMREVSPQELPTHRWSSIEIAATPKMDSMSSTVSPTIGSDHPSSMHSISPTLAGPAPTYGSHYNPPPQLGAVYENHASQYPYGQRSPTELHGHLETQNQGPTYSPPQPQPQQPVPYNPQEHALHHQHFPPPPSSPRSAQTTPAQFYGKTSPTSSRFIEGAE